MMTSRTLFNIFLTGIMLLISSCGNDTDKDNPIRNATVKSTEAIDTTATAGTNQALPSGFTMNNIQHAFEEYINYRLWFYPSKVEGNEGEFEPYIGKEIEAEIRIYDIEPYTVYLHTSIGSGLSIIKIDNGMVYVDGLVEESESHAPKGKYKVIDQLSVKVGQPQKPDYGHSPRKDKMIAAVETYISASCKDLLSGEEKEKWANAQFYIVDFYEYETGATVWMVRQDGYAWSAAAALTEENGDFKAEGLNSYGLKNVKDLDPYDPGRYMFDKQIKDAVKQVTCK